MFKKLVTTTALAAAMAVGAFTYGTQAKADDITVAVAGPMTGGESAFRMNVLSAVLMPDHLHFIVAPAKDRETRVGNVSAAIKRWMREEMKATWQWQPGCFDRLLRSGESLRDKWLYVEENPVRAGLVSRWQDWPYRYEADDPEL